MDIMTVGGASAQVKQLYAQRDADSAIREKSGQSSRSKNDSFMLGEKPKWLEDREKLEKKRSDARVNLIVGKLDKGKDLSPAELSFLGRKRPELYAEAAAVQRKKKYIEKKLRQCKSKQDVYFTGLTAASMGMPCGSAHSAAATGAKPYWASTGLNNTYCGFLGTAQYAKLPQTNRKKRLDSKA